MDHIVLGVFALTYLGMALGRVPGLQVDRTGIAVIGVVVLLATGRVSVETLGSAIDVPTLLLLFALMIVSAQFQAAGFYAHAAARIAASTGSPSLLLGLTVLVGGALSAVLANDVVVFAMTPILAAGIRHRGLDPRPFLIALAGASNAGSAATVIGNPQNILIGQTGALDFAEFLMVCGPPASVALLLVWLVVRHVWRRELAAPAVPADTDMPKAQTWPTLKGALAVLVLMALFLGDGPRVVGAMAVAGLLLASRSLGSRQMLGMVDWHLLLLFAGLFVITDRFAATGLTADLLAQAASWGFTPDRAGVLAPLLLAMSNTIGNVPAVMLLLQVWPDLPPGTFYAMALLSTLAGNLLLVGSLANIIVAERAASVGVRLSFADHARCGIPMTVASLAVAILWLVGGGWLAL